jgi:predicted transcriptional regulator with HTH domain
MSLLVVNSGKFTEFLPYFVVSKQTAYKWLRRYKEDLINEGIIEEKKKGRLKYVYVNDFNRLVDFFRDKGVYLIES